MASSSSTSRCRCESIDRHGCTAADVDGSGLPDLYCAVGGKRGSGLKSNELWLDPGGPAPVEVAVEQGRLRPDRPRPAGGLPGGRASRTTSTCVVTNSPTRVDGLPSLAPALHAPRGDGGFKAKDRPGFAPRLGALRHAGRRLRQGRPRGPAARDRRPTGAASRAARGSTATRARASSTSPARWASRSFDEMDAELVDLNQDGKLDLVQLSPTKLTRQPAEERQVQEGLRAQADRRPRHRHRRRQRRRQGRPLHRAQQRRPQLARRHAHQPQRRRAAGHR